jgi:hypothetical protein
MKTERKFELESGDIVWTLYHKELMSVTTVEGDFCVHGLYDVYYKVAPGRIVCDYFIKGILQRIEYDVDSVFPAYKLEDGTYIRA